MLTCRSGDDETSVTKQYSKPFVTRPCEKFAKHPAKFTIVREVLHILINYEYCIVIMLIWSSLYSWNRVNKFGLVHQNISRQEARMFWALDYIVVLDH